MIIKQPDFAAFSNFGHTTKSHDHQAICNGKLASTSCWLESCELENYFWWLKAKFSKFPFDKISVLISGIGQTFGVLSKALISELLFGSCVVALSSVTDIVVSVLGHISSYDEATFLFHCFLADAMPNHFFACSQTWRFFWQAKRHNCLACAYSV